MTFILGVIIGCAVGVVIMFTAREADKEIYKNKEKHNG
jgi:hypothetical protein